MTAPAAEGFIGGASTDAFWRIKTGTTSNLAITSAVSGSAYGLTGSLASAQTYYVGAGDYSADENLLLEFKGKLTTKTVAPAFLLKGTFANLDAVTTFPVERLKDASTYFELPTVLDSGLVLSTERLDFAGGQQASGLLTLSIPTNVTATYGVFETLTTDADLFDVSGNALFGANNSITWNGMTVQRAFTDAASKRGVMFTFTGTPLDSTLITDLYVGAKTTLDTTNYSGPYLFGPVRVTITPSTGYPYLTVTPRELNVTVDTTMTMTTVDVTSSTGNAVTISGFKQGSTAATSLLTSANWNNLTIRKTADSKITVSGTPRALGSETFYIYDGTSADPAILRITASSGSAPSLYPSASSIPGVVGTALSETVNITSSVTSGTITDLTVSPASQYGVTLTVDGTGIKIGGTPTSTGTIAVTVGGKVNGAQANVATFNVVVTSSATPALRVDNASLSGVAGTAMGTNTIMASSTTTGTVVVTGLTLSGTTATSHTWQGLTISTSGTGNTISVSGTPTVSGTATFTVVGTVGGAAATSSTFTITVNPAGTPGTPSLSLSSTGISTTTMSTLDRTITVSSTTSGTVAVAGVSGGGQSSASTDFTWNGLRIRTSGTSITVTGTPTTVNSATFTVSGTVGGVAATSATFSISVTSGSASLFGSTSTWEVHRNDTNKTYELYIPVTSTFTSAFDRNNDGKVTRDEIQSVLADLDTPYASLLGSIVYDMIDDGETLYLKFNFNPNSGHSLDWYVNMVLDALQVTGTNGTVLSQLFPNGISLSALREYYTSSGSSGCDAGFGALALLALGAAVVLRKKD